MLKGIGLKVGATVLFAGMAVLVKLAGPDYPTGQIMFCRSFFALIPIGWLVWRDGGLHRLKTTRPLAHVGRSFIGFAAMICGFNALVLLPLADATALGFAAPLMTTALAALLLGEVVRIYRWTAVGVGFLGILLMAQPTAIISGEISGLGVAASLMGAFLASIAMIFIKRMTASEAPITIVFYFTLTCTILAGTSLFYAAKWPDVTGAALLVGMGILGGLAQHLMTSSYKYADASVLAPIDYIAMVWAVVLGFMIFGERPAMPVLAGAAIVTLSGLFIVWRERQIGIAKTRPPERVVPL